MAKKLSAIAITHISLVKAGANGKSIIYKSSDAEPSYVKMVDIKKSDEEGVVYGIVYAPDDVDTDGDYASADEIKKAAYSFMKAKNTANVDKQHSFKIEQAFIAQSWILKDGDATFPDEKEGSWAVAIQLEDDELIKSVKDGEIAGISMAGTATKEEVVKEVHKADEKNFSLNDLLGAITKMFSADNNKINKTKEENDLNEEELEEAIRVAIEPLVKKVSTLEEEIKTLKEGEKVTKEALKKSKQDDGVPPAATQDSTGGIL